jgi:hypothetical protein
MDMGFVGDEVAFDVESRVIVVMLDDSGWSGVIGSAVNVCFEPADCLAKVEGRVLWTYAKIQAKAKQGSKCWGRFHCLGEIVNCQVPWSLEVKPGWHISEGDAGVFFDCFGSICAEAKLFHNFKAGIS